MTDHPKFRTYITDEERAIVEAALARTNSRGSVLRYRLRQWGGNVPEQVREFKTKRGAEQAGRYGERVGAFPFWEATPQIEGVETGGSKEAHGG